MKLIKIVVTEKSRLSGTGKFPAPQKKDIGRDVIIILQCLDWNGVLGYFEDDTKRITYAFYLQELNKLGDDKNAISNIR